MTIEKTCLACGAVLEDGKECQAIFDEFLVLEFTDPAYGAVHFLTVACFMVQHGRYSDQGQAWIKEQLRRHLEEGVGTYDIRRSASEAVQSSSRDWKIMRPPDAPPPPPVNWSMHITDVYQGYTDSEGYCRLIRQWGKSTVSDMP